ncbi:hypothetical protein OU995_11635 [Roseateles sp. SL47]|uniref:hypothetical protein n=1 Tax=Roseateles sp. SL47 TaxID=2995138 RepID=UPI00226FEBA0|nr:hypothetical protein [Roseateles sp. SL47]WAC75300.1 hypothetical protein OU995_11635 [Roseateles sp. SL47]
MPSATVRPWGASGHTRTAGLIVVALVHVAMVAALVEGFRRHAAPKPPPLTQVTVDIVKQPSPKVEPVRVPEPPLQQPIKQLLVEIPEMPPVTPTVPAATPSTAAVATSTSSTAEPMVSGGADTGTTTPPVPAQRETVTPAMVCTSTGTPDMPSVHWAGEAVFRVVAEVQAGRVVSADIRTLQGTMDSRTRRAFTQSIETALKQHYVCPGNHRFQQDFGFRVD